LTRVKHIEELKMHEADEPQPWAPGARPEAAPLTGRQLTDYSDDPGFAIRLPA
jgi:hypothetical protein